MSSLQCFSLTERAVSCQISSGCANPAVDVVCFAARRRFLRCNLPHRAVIVFFATYAHAVKGATLVEGNAALQFGPVALPVAEPVENGLRPHPAGLCQFKHGSIAGIAA